MNTHQLGSMMQQAVASTMNADVSSNESILKYQIQATS